MRIQIVGRGRMGAALAEALRGAGAELLPPGGRGASGEGAGIVLLAVPDAAIAEAAAGILPGRLVGHLSGATGLGALLPHEAFSLHPLLTVTGAGTSFAGAHAAIDGSSERALETARDLARLLGLETFRVADEDRAAYHAAASVASNYLVVLEGFAEQLAASAGVPRRALAPLARAALGNWAELGAAAALTGPIARGDEATVAAQRAAVAERLPGRLELFDALADAARELADSARGRTDSARGCADSARGCADSARERTDSARGRAETGDPANSHPGATARISDLTDVSDQIPALDPKHGREPKNGTGFGPARSPLHPTTEAEEPAS